MTIPPLHDVFKVASWLALPVETATVDASVSAACCDCEASMVDPSFLLAFRDRPL